jgi:hypothetical protein
MSLCEKKLITTEDLGAARQLVHDAFVEKGYIEPRPGGIRVRKFEAFRQGDGTAARRYGDCGLGLAIASQLTRLMAGRIWLDKRTGQGSTVHFTLPL